MAAVHEVFAWLICPFDLIEIRTLRDTEYIVELLSVVLLTVT
jgi:hypothetical protein